MPEYTDKKRAPPVPDWVEQDADDKLTPAVSGDRGPYKTARDYNRPAASGSEGGQGGYIKPTKQERPDQRLERYRQKADVSAMERAMEPPIVATNDIHTDITEDYDENGQPMVRREKNIANLGDRMGQVGGDYVREHPELQWSPEKQQQFQMAVIAAKARANALAAPVAGFLRQATPGGRLAGWALDEAAKAGQAGETPVADPGERGGRDITSYKRSDSNDNTVTEYSEEEMAKLKKALENARKESRK